MNTIFILLSLLLSVLSESDENYLRCDTSCSKQRTSIWLSEGQKLTCSIKAKRGTPWPDENDKTAYKPRKLNIGWYIYDNKRIALNITWQQKVSELLDEQIKGYLLIIGIMKYTVDLSYEKTNGSGYLFNAEKWVHFSYQCTGRSNSYIRTGENIIVFLHSLPMYHERTRVQALRRNITIPSCFEDERLVHMENYEIATKECKDAWNKIKRIQKTTKEPRNKTIQSSTKPVIVHQRMPDNTIYFVLASVLGAFLFLIIIMAAAVRDKRNKNRKYSGERRILVIADNKDEEIGLEEIHRMTAWIRHECNLQIECNWENRVAISADWLDWYSNSMNESNIIVFVVTYNKFCESLTLTKTRDSEPELKQAFNRAHIYSTQGRAEIIILLIGKVNFIQQMSATLRAQYVVYSVLSTYEDFLKHVTGNDITKEKLKKLKNELGNGNISSSMNSPEERPLLDPSHRSSRTNSNSLEVVESFEITDSVVSIYDNVHNAQSSNTQKIERYRKAGAIPKKESRNTQ